MKTYAYANKQTVSLKNHMDQSLQKSSAKNFSSSITSKFSRLLNTEDVQELGYLIINSLLIVTRVHRRQNENKHRILVDYSPSLDIFV